jgi:hypothetical protein
LYIDIINKEIKSIIKKDKMSLINLDLEKGKKSLEVRNELIKMIREKFDMNLSYSFNDLYKVKDGVVRRLKGGLWRVDYGIMNMKEWNDKFNEIKEFVDNLEIEDFDIKLNKRLDYSWDGYLYWLKNMNFEGNFLDYKKMCLENEGVVILKIKWKC